MEEIGMMPVKNHCFAGVEPDKMTRRAAF